MKGGFQIQMVAVENAYIRNVIHLAFSAQLAHCVDRLVGHSVSYLLFHFSQLEITIEGKYHKACDVVVHCTMYPGFSLEIIFQFYLDR